MFEKLEAYLEEISHFLSGREEREEILPALHRPHGHDRSHQEPDPHRAKKIGALILGTQY
jgi:hypothetical protein